MLLFLSGSIEANFSYWYYFDLKEIEFEDIILESK